MGVPVWEMGEDPPGPGVVGERGSRSRVDGSSSRRPSVWNSVRWSVM